MKLNSPDDRARVHALACIAEDWLMENDPDYATTSKDWQHVDGASFTHPSREIIWDEEENGSVTDLLDNGTGRYVGAAPRRLCEPCGYLFTPSRLDGNGQRFCSNACKQRDYRRRKNVTATDNR